MYKIAIDGSNYLCNLIAILEARVDAIKITQPNYFGNSECGKHGARWRWMEGGEVSM